MRNLIIAAAGMLSLSAALAQHGDHAGHGAAARTNTVVFAVPAIHCQACVDALQPALAKVAGVKSAQASSQGKTVVVSFEEGKTGVQALAQVIAGTPSPMPDSSFQPALLLEARGPAGHDAAGRLSAALKAVKGVTDATVRDDRVISITFAAEPAVHLTDLVKASGKVGFKVSPLAAKRASRPAGGGEAGARSAHGCCGN